MMRRRTASDKSPPAGRHSWSWIIKGSRSLAELFGRSREVPGAGVWGLRGVLGMLCETPRGDLDGGEVPPREARALDGGRCENEVGSMGPLVAALAWLILASTSAAFGVHSAEYAVPSIELREGATTIGVGPAADFGRWIIERRGEPMFRADCGRLMVEPRP